MAIRVTYGDIGAYAQLGALAGQAQAAQAEAARRHQLALQQMSERAAMDRQMAAIQAQREAQEFSAWLQLESDKRARAWEQEKIEIAARNRFAMEEQAFMWEQELRNKEKLQAMQERQRKLKAIQKQVEDGFLSEEEATRARIAIETGLAPGMYETGGSAWEKAIFQMMKPELHERGLTAQDAERVAAMPGGNLRRKSCIRSPPIR